MTTTTKTTVARIRRILAKNDRKLKTSRSWGEKHNLGDHYIVDIYTNVVVDHHVDLGELGTELALAAEQEQAEKRTAKFNFHVENAKAYYDSLAQRKAQKKQAKAVSA
jgi:hypothetical protein